MGDPKRHCCPYEGCNAAFNRPYRLTQHLLVHNNVKAYACYEENCLKSYTSKSHLERHVNTVHRRYDEDVIYSCPTCLKKYANRQNLKRHIKIHHNLRIPFSCDSCNIEFKKKHQLSAHMYIHTGIKAFSCEICSKEFVTLLEKKKHMRCHKSYTCSECPQVFKQWSKYQAHLKSDHESKEYICDVCQRTFKQRTHIIRHIRIHDPSKVVTCPYENCNRFYSRNSNLKQHILMKHEKITHDCSICNAKLTTKKKLQEHIVKIHKSEQKVWVPKTKLMGRKVRKDIGTLKISTALQLAGLPATYEEKPVEKSEKVPDKVEINVA